MVAYGVRPMPRHVLALLCLTACAAPDPAAPERKVDAPAPAPPVSLDIRPVPADGPPRLLAADVERFGVLADGALLILDNSLWPEIAAEPTYRAAGSLERIDPTTGARSPWGASWTATGWKLGRGGEPRPIGFEVSRDGRWVAVAHSFEIRRNSAISRPELVALVVARSDGSDPRCVGVAVPSDDPPPYAFSRDGRLIGDWTVQCTPGPHGVPLPLRADGELDAWPRPQQWYDPTDGSRGEVPELEPWWYDKDPLGDNVAMQGGELGDPPGLEFRDFATGARLGVVPRGDGPGLRAREWVTADMLLAEVLNDDAAVPELRLVTTDGRTFPAPHTQWRVHAAPGRHTLV